MVATVALPSPPWSIALNQRTGTVYVTTAGSAVTVIDKATISVTSSVALATSDASVAVIAGERDATSGTIPVPTRPWVVAVIPETNRVYVTSP